MKAALQVTLPEGFHVQSNKPRDASLIATELTLDPPAGIRGAEVVFPEAVEFRQEGLPEPLVVFDRRFTIGVQLAFAADLAPGPRAIPFTLRYQACDDKVCFAPSTARGEWTVQVVPAGAAVTAQHADVLGAIAFGTGETPVVAPPPFRTTPATPVAADDAGLATAGSLHGRLDHRRLSGHRRLHDLHPQRRGRRDGARAVRGPRAAGHPAASCSSAGWR